MATTLEAVNPSRSVGSEPFRCVRRAAGRPQSEDRQGSADPAAPRPGVPPEPRAEGARERRHPARARTNERSGRRCGDADRARRTRPKKAPNAFRTISEVADELHIPQHVLRFWETKFPQVKPLKRGGGRRYYRPDDIALLRRISDLLYIQGYTIKGVQRLLREGGGRLSDDIPPPPAPTNSRPPRRNGRPGAFEPELPMPGLALQRLRRRQRGRVRGRDADPEAERLRAVLAETLRELEALRALLPLSGVASGEPAAGKPTASTVGA